MVTRVYVDHVKAKAKLGTGYRDCPEHCPKAPEGERWNINRESLCKACPLTRERRNYIREAEETLTTVLGEGHGYPFERIERAITVLRNMKGLGDEMYLKNYIALQEIRTELQDG